MSDELRPATNLPNTLGNAEEPIPQEEGSETQSEPVVSAIAKTSPEKVKTKMKTMAKSASDTPARPPPNFLDLPPELRTMIFEFLLVTPGPARVYVANFDYFINRGAIDQKTTLAIRGVCKQANMEASNIYFGQNTFKFDWTDMMKEWLEKIGQQNRSYVKSVILDLNGKARVKGLQLLKKCASLQKLELVLTYSSLYGIKRKPGRPRTVREAPGMNQLLKLRGLREVVVTDASSPNWRLEREVRDIEEVTELLKTELCKPRKLGRGTQNQ